MSQVGRERRMAPESCASGESSVQLAEDLSLRAMTPADVAEVLALEQRLFPQDAWPERFFDHELAHAEPALPPERATRRYWVVEQSGTASRTGGSGAEESGRILGYAGLLCVLPIADVQTIAVAPEAQGRGLGTMLLHTMIDEARRRGAEQVLLEVRSDNPGAQTLYRREGFAHIHTRPRYYRDGQDALIMQKPLKDLNAPTSASTLRGRPQTQEENDDDGTADSGHRDLLR